MMPVLDADELLHLGLHATRSDKPESAIEYFKQCLESSPDHPQATYLLGAVYAQIGLYDRAKDLLNQALLLNPQEYTGVFQLGLLHLTSGDVELARKAWHGLEGLPDDHYLQLFKSAMLELVVDNFSECVEHIERGIAANTANEALNNDMRRVQAAAEAAKSESDSARSDSPNLAASHLVLTGYQQAQKNDER